MSADWEEEGPTQTNIEDPLLLGLGGLSWDPLSGLGRSLASHFLLVIAMVIAAVAV